MFSAQTIRTARLILRPPQAGDGPDLYHRVAGDPEVTRHLPSLPHSSVQESCQFVAACMNDWARAAGWTWILAERGNPAASGYLQITRSGGSVALSFALARPLWGRGYMPEAVRQVIALAFEDPTLFRVGALCRVTHWASIRVLEKAGMSREGLLRKVLPRTEGEPADAYSYARVRGMAPRAYAPWASTEAQLLGHAML